MSNPAMLTEPFACQRCHAPLVVARLPPGTTVLCAGCGWATVLPAAPDTRRLSRKALASVVLGVGSLVGSCLAGWPAIVVGWLALGDLRRAPDRLKGRRAALAGICLGLLLPLVCSPFQLALVLPAVQAVRGEAARGEGGGDTHERKPSQPPMEPPRKPIPEKP
jgi:hypothetical protein